MLSLCKRAENERYRRDIGAIYRIGIHISPGKLTRSAKKFEEQSRRKPEAITWEEQVLLSSGKYEIHAAVQLEHRI
jgi:hypothetical protein